MEKEPREKLIEAGTRLFATKGLAAVTIRELSEAAGTNSAMISYYFGGKEGLYQAILEAHFSKIRATVETAATMNLEPIDTLRMYAHGVMTIHTQSPYLTRLMFAELTNPTGSFQPIVKQSISAVASFLGKAIAKGIEKGQIRQDINPAYAALSLAGMMNFFFIGKPLIQELLPQDADNERNYNRQALDIYLSGILPRNTG